MTEQCLYLCTLRSSQSEQTASNGPNLFHAPDLDRLVVRGRREVLAVKGPGDVGNAFCVAREALDVLSSADIPQLDDLVRAFASRPLSQLTDAQRQNYQ